MVCLIRPYHLKYFKGCLIYKFTWSILEFFVPNVSWNEEFSFSNIDKIIVMKKITNLKPERTSQDTDTPVKTLDSRQQKS